MTTVFAIEERETAKLDVKRAMDRLRERRIALGLSQARVAERLGTAQSAISDWEVGNTIPTALSLARLARLYGLRLNTAEVHP